MNNIEKEILKKITPTHEYREELKKIVEEIRNILEKETKKRKLPTTIELVGSIAKDTYLQNNMDVDFFICFPTNYPKEEIAKQALEIGKTFLKKTEESYAEHPYLRGYYKDFYIEIVPCYKIENAKQKLSAVDRTPLHTKFVKENITEEQKGQVRLFKQFLKGINCYGAEAQIQGFSGYLCEITLLKYGTFQDILKNAKIWKFGEKLSLKKSIFADFDTPLVFIDPVDKDRNVASALTEEKFNLFIKACKDYLEKPKSTFFFPNPVKPWSVDKIKETIDKQDCKYIGITFEKPDIIDENLYPQIRKTTRSIEDSLKRADFKVHGTAYSTFEEKIYVIIKTQKEKLSKTMIHVGPPVKKESNSQDFINKWKDHSDVIRGPYKEENRWKVEIKRQYTEAIPFLKNQIKYLSMGKHLDEIIKKKYEIIEQDMLLNKNLREFWTRYLDRKESWER